MKFIVKLAGLAVLFVSCMFTSAVVHAQSETNFVSIDPCRIFDTRMTTSMGAGEERNFFVFEIEAGDIGGQGGKEGGCNIPSDATAVQLSFTAVNSAGNGFMRAWAWGESQPNATLLNYFDQGNLSNSTAVPVCANICLFDMTIKTFNSATDLVGDAVGYYVPVPGVFKELIEEERAHERSRSLSPPE